MYQIIPRTLCFVFNPDNEILLLERSAHKFDAGMCNVLGGHIEKGEDVLKSAEREIIEECGIKPEFTKLIGLVHAIDFNDTNDLMVVTVSLVNTSKFKDSVEGKLKWVKLEDLKKYNIYADILPFIDKVIQDKFFTAVSIYDGKTTLKSLKFY